MALKMLYRGPSSRLETLIEKIQQNKEQDIFSSHTSSSFSPSLSDDIPTTPNSLINHHHSHHHHHHHHLQNDDHHQTNHNNNNNNTDKLIGGSTAAIDLKRKSCDADHELNGGGVLDETKKIKCENFVKDIKTTGHGGGGGISQNGGTMKHPNKSSKISSDGNYHCQFCEKVFPRLGYLKKHEQSHAEHMPFKCEYCARLFKHKRSRDRHTKLHTGDRRYKCPHCEAAFSRSDHLKIHMKTHDNQKPFQCTVCNRGYNTAAALTSHMQNHKKQAALLANGGNGGNLSYSPRSTGSTGSSTSSLHKRKYSNIPLDQLNPQQQQQQIHQPQQKLLRPMISCVFCTKSDFQNVDQLNHHVQAMHHQITTHATSAGSNPASLASSPVNPMISCEFCTMKFGSIQQIFQHLKSTHMDRISSPNSYLEHFNRSLMSTYDMGQSAISPTSLLYRNKFLPVVKQESKTPEITTDAPANPITTPPVIKHEAEDPPDQDSPTDLSQPKSKVFIKDESNHSATSNNHNVSNGDRTPEAVPKSPVHQGGTFLCNQCNAALPDFESFRTHLKSHLESGVGSYLCQHCGIPFNDQQIYEKHLFSHFLMNVTEYPCPQTCNKNFTKQEDYQKHMIDAHIQTVYRCEICTEIFDTKISIQVHMSVAHANEVKLYRCSACMEVYRNERDFRHHVRARHIVSGAVQCIFCRQICSSELDMHFHLAAHARQFRCPVCPESFHVEFLLDRHMQTTHHHGVTGGVATQDRPKEPYHHKIAGNNNNNNNNTIDYHLSGGAKPGHHQSYPFNTNKFYNQLQIDTLGAKHPNLLHGLYDSISKSQRYPPDNGFLSPNKNLLGIYNHPEMIAKLNSFYSQNENGERLYPSQLQSHAQQAPSATSSASRYSGHADATIKSHLSGTYSTHHGDKGYSCGMCERNDFSTENEVHSHRKLVHNLKTGVSLRCAYCNGDFRSRSELENHMKVSHNTSGKHKCLICDEIFPSPAVLAEHKLTHCKVGPSGRCSHCLIELKDVTFFKSHLAEHNGHDIPIQCICCRQTLNSEFEIGLHAKFHTKSTEIKENTCALCLETLPPNVETRVCESCYKKHNLNLKTNILQQHNNSNISNSNNNNNNGISSNNNSSNRDNLNINQEVLCNLCKKTLANQIRLQEHLIEHTFAGCEDRGYICYICSAVFTSPTGLQSHIIEHGLNARPYDCNLCPAKYFFRAELDNHTIEHDNNNIVQNKSNNVLIPPVPNHMTAVQPENLKKEITAAEENHMDEEDIKHQPDEEEEYIEVENLETNHENKLDNK